MSARARQCKKASSNRKQMLEEQGKRANGGKKVEPRSIINNLPMSANEVQAHLQRQRVSGSRINKKRPYDTRGNRKQNVYA